MLSKGAAMFTELNQVALRVDLPEHGLKAGDVGTIVLDHQGRGYEVEFVALSGQTLAVVSVYPEQVRAIGQREIANARVVESA
jgi:hypothetical protein